MIKKCCFIHSWKSFKKLIEFLFQGQLAKAQLVKCQIVFNITQNNKVCLKKSKVLICKY